MTTSESVGAGCGLRPSVRGPPFDPLLRLSMPQKVFLPLASSVFIFISNALYFKATTIAVALHLRCSALMQL